MSKITNRQLDILRHALGLSSSTGREYRNHFVTGPGSQDWDDCEALFRAGLMAKSGPREMLGGDFVFVCTDEGKRIARGGS